MEAPFAGEVGRAQVSARIEAHPIGGTPEAMRAAFARFVLGPAGVDGVTVEKVPHGLRLQPPDADATRCVVWLHGGGYVFGAPETHLRPATHLARTLGCPVLLPRYRLAPEHPWPAQRNDAVAAIRACLDAGVFTALVGDSAGGHLALVTALALAQAGRPVAGLVLLAPNTDRSGLSATRGTMTPHDPMNTDADDAQLAAMCFGDRPSDDREVSPALDCLAHLPPTYIEVGDREVLLGDAFALHLRAAASDMSCRLHVAPGLLHMGQLWAPWWPPAVVSLDRIAAFLKPLLAGGAN